ncbi:putative 3-hydroxybutyryl-CoA dehydrogenase [Virgisporangium aliadipatigenens]|uniref:Putative 3-hydroxybutyryl-CoA dehydrogenase n=1 Tax=Virgisporangium aliadipatigenens TaxID=741659 RepID=A0A8J4DNN4_9ACTN|nr:3-hydroxybutyryl-CoA dehydrogenase [Virgisporangium aliadipatigenens]GIJ43692.1 putative 3-hydroxybutyryl-CoA dehydrogenase [Virgisporangium aliadipatigenens]
MAEAVGVVGGGIMGSGIAEVAARSGCDVLILEVDEARCTATRERLERSLGKAVKVGKLDEAERDATLQRIRYTQAYEDFADRTLVIEAIIEDEQLKTTAFATLDKVVADPEAILASNTSSIPIQKLAAATGRPDRVIGLHFFNPVPVLPLVELIPSLLTSPETLERARRFAADQLGKQTVLAKDRAGFVVNALLIPYLLSAVRMVEGGFATPEDVDAAMVGGCAHPMGPLALADLIGLDTCAAVGTSMYEEYKEPLYAPPPLLLRMVEAGLLGRKSGRGFYTY